jgi:hypothetical protein
MAIAAADGFHGLGLSRRDAAWAIKGLRDEAMIVLTPVFNAMSARSVNCLTNQLFGEIRAVSMRGLRYFSCQRRWQ